MKIVRRGYLPDYEILFKNDGIEKIKEAGKDILYLLERGYRIKQASLFVQNHYLLSEEQRLCLSRVLATNANVCARTQKKLSEKDCIGKEVWIDGFNAIIPMETLISNSPIFKCMDGAIRDMANLKGSYRIIDKTENAIKLILAKLDDLQIKKAHFHIDRPISNSGRLKSLIAKLGEEYNVELDIQVIDAVDKSLYNKECVVSGDCVVMDNSISWIPLYEWIVNDYKKDHDVWLIDFSK